MAMMRRLISAISVFSGTDLGRGFSGRVAAHVSNKMREKHSQ